MLEIVYAENSEQFYLIQKLNSYFEIKISIFYNASIINKNIKKLLTFMFMFIFQYSKKKKKNIDKVLDLGELEYCRN